MEKGDRREGEEHGGKNMVGEVKNKNKGRSKEDNRRAEGHMRERVKTESEMQGVTDEWTSKMNGRGGEWEDELKWSSEMRQDIEDREEQV